MYTTCPNCKTLFHVKLVSKPAESLKEVIKKKQDKIPCSVKCWNLMKMKRDQR